MSRLRLLPVTIAIAGIALAVLAAPVAAKLRPTAVVEFAQTVTISGKHFKPKERLTVTLIGFEKYVRRVHATPRGSFHVDLGAISLSECNAYTLKVVGARGSRFSMSHPTAPC